MTTPAADSDDTMTTPLHRAARRAWSERNPVEKCRKVARLLASFTDHNTEAPRSVSIDCNIDAISLDDLEPGRPQRPELVHPAKVARRQTGSAGGRGAMLHAIAHIEFNAVNLALDAVWRYPGMPDEFARDWIAVAADEARHFSMLCAELDADGIAYGDFDAHDGLWAMARRTAHELISRMALVPRVLEARGLDATPVIQRKLNAIGDNAGVAVLDVLLEEEIRHVRIGDRWFRALCERDNVDAELRYRELIGEFSAPIPKGAMNEPARLAAGFSQSELDWLAGASRKT